ncbi:hypothetical protein MASR2M15_15180 [Anaerolineales bacterium]
MLSTHNEAHSGRPPTGWLAWQETLGYLYEHHSPDALLRLDATSHTGDVIERSASIRWAALQFAVTGRISAADALDYLWATIKQNVEIFQTPADAIIAPADYPDEEMFTHNEMNALNTVTRVLGLAFQDEWRMIILYQPIGDTNLRVQMRLLADNGRVQIAGQGATLRVACHQLLIYASDSVSYQLQQDKRNEDS